MFLSCSLPPASSSKQLQGLPLSLENKQKSKQMKRKKKSQETHTHYFLCGAKLTNTYYV